MPVKGSLILPCWNFNWVLACCWPFGIFFLAVAVSEWAFLGTCGFLRYFMRFDNPVIIQLYMIYVYNILKCIRMYVCLLT